MLKKWLIGLGLILLAAGIGYWLTGYRQSSQPLQTVKVERGKIADKAVAIGLILPRHSIKVKSRISGIVIKLRHDEGDWVKAGEPLLQIQPTPAPDKYDQLKRHLEMKQVKERARSAELRIIQAAYAVKAIEALKYHQAKENYEAAVLERQEAEEQLVLIEKGEVVIGGQKISSEITSPIDGFILARAINEGDPVVAQSEMQPGDILLTIADMTNLLFKGEVSELDAVKLQEGMPAQITIGAIPDVIIQGKVGKIALQSEQANEVDSQASSSTDKSKQSKFNVGFKVEINELHVPAKLNLKSGFSATADILIHEISDALIIPERVLQFKEGKTYVQLLKDGQPILQSVDVGISDGIRVQILQGLQEGQEVLDEPIK